MPVRMDDFVVHDVRPDLRVIVTREMPALPPALDAEVEALWRTACARVAAGGAGALFNGRVFSADTITPTTITGHLSEFRRIVAQMQRPALFDALRVRPLAVCGVLYSADGVAFGRRHAGAVYQADMWQLPPAGSVDAHAVDANGAVAPVRQVLNELREEVGLLPEDVDAPLPLCVVEHPGSHVSDLGMALRCRVDGAAIREAHARHGNGEYPTLRIVPLPELAAFVIEAGATMVPPAPIFLRRIGLL
ncbi:MAG TPA: NUDIX hydrolase [Acetobacteraceae bacterium]|nr:NUDIX hydrolase [Acetobacteraceae bacterium]